MVENFVEYRVKDQSYSQSLRRLAEKINLWEKQEKVEILGTSLAAESDCLMALVTYKKKG